MTRVVLFAATVAVAVMVAVWFANDPGSVSIQWRGWQIDTSVGILLVMIAGVTLFVLGVFKVAAVIGGAAASLAAARKERRMAQGLRTLGYGFAAAHAGQAHAARKYAKEAAALLDDITATHLLTAQAAVANSDGATLRTAAVHLLEQPETELSALRDLAAQARSEGDLVGALNFAKRALTRKDTPRWAIDMTLDMLMGSGRWQDAVSTLESKTARAAYTADDYKKLKAAALTYAGLDALRHKDADAAESLSRKAMDLGAGSDALTCHARALILLGKHKKAAGEIEAAWGKHPSSALLPIFLEAGGAVTALDQARRVEKLVDANPDHPESRLALAEVSLKAQLWGQARNRLAPLLGDEVPHTLQARAAFLMSELETSEHNDPVAGAQWMKRAIEKVSAVQSHPSHTPRTVQEVLSASLSQA